MPLLTELEPQQKDHLCGPFHAARVLRDHGVTEFRGEPVDQDLVALRAGTALPASAVDDEVPPGAASHRDYRHELLRADPAQAGTSARALSSAIEEMSGGQLACVPLSGRWSAQPVEGVLGLEARLIANVRTGLFWGSRPPLDALLEALDGNEVSDPPPADWDVGHFVELVALVRGRHGALVAVRDSYPTLGFDGAHLQPAAAVAAALNRGDGRGGGVLAVVTSGHVEAVERLAADLGLETSIWDN